MKYVNSPFSLTRKNYCIFPSVEDLADTLLQLVRIESSHNDTTLRHTPALLEPREMIRFELLSNNPPEGTDHGEYSGEYSEQIPPESPQMSERLDIAVGSHNGKMNSISSRVWWAVEASHEMLFHWLCPPSFNNMRDKMKKKHCSVQYNLMYWLCFAATFLSLFLGREVHILFCQGWSMPFIHSKFLFGVRWHVLSR